jgi:hypothetical protein
MQTSIVLTHSLTRNNPSKDYPLLCTFAIRIGYIPLDASQNTWKHYPATENMTGSSRFWWRR